MDPQNEAKPPYLSLPVWLTYLALFTIGIPWDWPEGDATLWLGMPAWVVVAIGVSVAISIFTACLLNRSWPGETRSCREDERP